MRKVYRFLFLLLLPFLSCTADKEQNQLKVSIKIDAAENLGEARHIWQFFGADEPNYAYMKNGKKLLGDLGSFRPGEVYFRAHNLLNTDEGPRDALKWGSTNMYTEDEAGNPVYSWTVIDSIFDAYLNNGVRPYVQIGFMPKALSSHPEPYRHHWNPSLPYREVFTGWAYPPNDYDKWEELCYQWARHCVERYGKDEVEQWYWQTWNEPNINYWQGTVEEYCKLHDYAIHGILRALPSARIGGPDVAGSDHDKYGSEFFKAFVDHCVSGTNYVTGEQGTKLDFVSFHAKGRPEFVDGHVRMGIWHQLTVTDYLFRTISENPAIKDLPVIIGESDPEGCAACQGEQLGYRNGTMYSSYTAASFVRKLDLARKYGVNFEGALTWAFEFENQPYFAGFRALSSNGINKPVRNVFKMFSMMDGNRVAVHSDGAVSLDTMIHTGVRGTPDVSAYATADDNKIYIMAWHYHDDDVDGPAAQVDIQLENLIPEKGKALVDVYLIDKTHSNAYTVWQSMGSPQDPVTAQYQQLEKSSELEKITGDQMLKIRDHRAGMNLTLERTAVALIVVKF